MSTLSMRMWWSIISETREGGREGGREEGLGES